jgi:sigma-B regulation protein RsbU (phosphoserine phosphatase)
MTHLSAIFRSLISLDLPLAETMSRANRLFCEGVAPSQYATVVCGRATPEGVELANAGHCRPLLIRRNGAEELDSTGLPLGLFCGIAFPVIRIGLDRGDSLVCYTDGVTEAQNPAGEEYGCQRLADVLRDLHGRDARSMTEGALRDVASFRGALRPSDDMTLLAIRRR